MQMLDQACRPRQKPQRPGSAQARLADALGVREIGAGEKPDGS
jgi:hypothetical protein